MPSSWRCVPGPAPSGRADVILGIDHLVIAVDDPDAAAAELEAKLGLAAAGGGRHEALGTFNRLIWLGDSFLELVGVFDRGLAEASWFGPAAAGGPRAGRRARDLGGGRRRPRSAPALGTGVRRARRPDRRRAHAAPMDGIVRWRLARPPEVSPSSPFLIEHDTAAAEWTPDERAARAAEEHPVGGRVRLLALEVENAAPAPAAGRLRSMLGTSVEPAGRAGVSVHVGPHAVRLLAQRPRGPAGGRADRRHRDAPADGAHRRLRDPPGRPSAETRRRARRGRSAGPRPSVTNGRFAGAPRCSAGCLTARRGRSYARRP